MLKYFSNFLSVCSTLVNVGMFCKETPAYVSHRQLNVQYSSEMDGDGDWGGLTRKV